MTPLGGLTARQTPLRITRTGMEHAALMARNMMSDHTDMQDKYCGDAAEGRATSFMVAAASRHLGILALNRVNIVAVTTILVFHVGVIGHHVPRH